MDDPKRRKAIYVSEAQLYMLKMRQNMSAYWSATQRRAILKANNITGTLTLPKEHSSDCPTVEQDDIALLNTETRRAAALDPVRRALRSMFEEAASNLATFILSTTQSPSSVQCTHRSRGKLQGRQSTVYCVSARQ